jgi:hypothetical protein
MNELEQIKYRIFEIRGQRVMLDFVLANMYGVETRVLNQAVKRNIERFPEDFMFQLTKDEMENLKSQIVISSSADYQGDSIWISQIVTSNFAKMGLRKKPYAFTEQGVAMLSSVLRSPLAIQVNIGIMRAFVAIRQALPAIASQKDLEDLKQRVKALEESGSATQTAVEDIRNELTQVYEVLTQLGEKRQEPLPEIGFEAIQKRREEGQK